MENSSESVFLTVLTHSYSDPLFHSFSLFGVFVRFLRFRLTTLLDAVISPGILSFLGFRARPFPLSSSPCSMVLFPALSLP